MSILETLVIAFLVFSAFCALVEAVQKVLVARAKRPACPCQDLHSLTLTPGAVFELPPGTEISPATEAPSVVRREVADLHTTFSTEGVEGVAMSFEDCRDALDIERAKSLLNSDEEAKRLQGEIFMLRMNLRRVRRGLPSIACA